MRHYFVSTLFIAPLLASPVVAADRDSLQGTWIVESAEFLGKKNDELKGKSVVFAGDKFIINFGGLKQTSVYKTDNSKTPQQLDVVGRLPDGGEMKSLAIYKIDGDTLTICTGGGSAESPPVRVKPGEKPGKPPEIIYVSDPRPTAFDSSKAALMVLTRKK